MTPEQLKAYHARMAELKSKIDFSTKHNAREDNYHRKSFIDTDGNQIDTLNPEKSYRNIQLSTGNKFDFGMPPNMSHMGSLDSEVYTPKGTLSSERGNLGLNKMGTRIHSFKDMDKVIDENELLRVIDEKNDGRTISTGNTITQNQMDIIKANFEQAKKDGIPMRAKITSNSRKKFKTWGDFEKAVAEHQDDSKPDFEAIAESERRRLDNEDIGNKEFISHTARLAGN